MKLSTKGRYAFRMMLELALNCPGRPVLLREIGEKQQISPRYLEQLALNLKAAGLVRSVRGMNGGFMLGRSAESITLLDIFRASEGDSALVDCTMNPALCERNKTCATQEIWAGIRDLLDEFLESRTLAQLAEKQAALQALRRHDYSI